MNNTENSSIVVEGRTYRTRNGCRAQVYKVFPYGSSVNGRDAYGAIQISGKWFPCTWLLNGDVYEEMDADNDLVREEKFHWVVCLSDSSSFYFAEEKEAREHYDRCFRHDVEAKLIKLEEVVDGN